MALNRERWVYKVRFITPAFLGGADQNGQWRTPPFKAMLRYWWRIVWAQRVGYDWEKLREVEGLLFGHAHLQHNKHTWALRSCIQMRLRSEVSESMSEQQWVDVWSAKRVGGGRMMSYQVETSKGKSVRTDVYLGYGPISFKQPYLSRRPLSTKSVAHLEVLVDSDAINRCADHIHCDPADLYDSVQAALALANHWGTIGARSHNGWGSLQLSIDAEPRSILRKFRWARYWEDSLALSWPHAVGLEGAHITVWHGPPQESWVQALQEIALVKAALRAIAKRYRIREIRASAAFLLGYPAGKQHNLTELGKRARWASPLRYKVVHKPDGSFQPIVVHLPTGLPDPLRNKLARADSEVLARISEETPRVWSQIYRYLDQHQHWTRLSLEDVQ